MVVITPSWAASTGGGVGQQLDCPLEGVVDCVEARSMATCYADEKESGGGYSRPRGSTIGGRDQVQRKIRRVVDGDRDAAGWLYDTFADRLFRRLRQRYGYPGGLDAEDLLQDTFIQLFQHDCRVLRRFLERHGDAPLVEAQVERYIWNLACGIATNRRRASGHRKVVPLIEPDREQVDPTAERQVVDRDTLVQLDACLEGRGARVHVYHRFRHRDGLTPAEIVDATGWSRKAVYKLKQALNEALHACAEQLGIGQGAGR